MRSDRQSVMKKIASTISANLKTKGMKAILMEHTIKAFWKSFYSLGIKKISLKTYTIREMTTYNPIIFLKFLSQPSHQALENQLKFPQRSLIFCHPSDRRMQTRYLHPTIRFTDRI